MAVGLLVSSAFVAQFAIVPSQIQTPEINQQAGALDGVYDFLYSSNKQKKAVLHAPIPEDGYVWGYDVERKLIKQKRSLPRGEVFADAVFESYDGETPLWYKEATGDARDQWGYPLSDSGPDKDSTPKVSFVDIAFAQEDFLYESIPDPSYEDSIFWCRDNPDQDSFFQVRFMDLADETGQVFDDSEYGLEMMTVVCDTLVEVAEKLGFDQMENVRPRIQIESWDLGNAQGVMASSLSPSTDGFLGTGLYKEIVQGGNPSRGASVSSPDVTIAVNKDTDWSTDLMRSVFLHETLHALGFLTRHGMGLDNGGEFSLLNSLSYANETSTSSFVNPQTLDFSGDTSDFPSSDFLTNEVVLKPLHNIVDAEVLDESYPVYSPAVWEVGSSFSHYDEDRTNFDNFIMHPTTSLADPTTDVHDGEWQALCSLGFYVEDICPTFTPVTNSEFADMSPGADSVCVNILENDYGVNEDIEIYDVEDVLSGSVEVYSDENCSGDLLSGIGGQSVSLVLNENTENMSVKYRAYGLDSGRISFPGIVSTMRCSDDNYICNGGFEGGVETTHGELEQSCPSNIPFWCNLRPSTDIFSYNNGFNVSWRPGEVGPEPQGFGNTRYISGSGCSGNGSPKSCENQFVQTHKIIDPGTYRLSWRAQFLNVLNLPYGHLDTFLTHETPEILGWENPFYSSLDTDMFEEHIVSGFENPNENTWESGEWVFTITEDSPEYQYVLFESYGDVNPELAENGQTAFSGRFYLDDVRLEKLCEIQPADFDGDTNVDSFDLMVMLSDMGCTGSDCQGDLDGNGVTNSGDFLEFLALFGQSCVVGQEVVFEPQFLESESEDVLDLEYGLREYTDIKDIGYNYQIKFTNTGDVARSVTITDPVFEYLDVVPAVSNIKGVVSKNGSVVIPEVSSGNTAVVFLDLSLEENTCRDIEKNIPQENLSDTFVKNKFCKKKR